MMMARPRLLAGEDLPAAPQQRRSAAKRERLKAAGLALFGERGYEHTSIEDVARRARLAVGTVYQHFRSKRQLLLTLMDGLLELMSELKLEPSTGGAVHPGGGDVRQVLRGLLERAFDRDLSYLGACRAWEEAVLSDPELAQHHAAIRAWTTRRVVVLFTALQQRPGARRDVDVAGLARVMDTFFWSVLAQAQRLSPSELKQSVDAATHLIYHGIFADPVGKGAKR